MSSGSKSADVYRFGVFEALPQAGELQKNGVRVKLQEQPFQLLIFLLENAGDIVSRESVRQRLWQGNTFVDFDASLSVAVGKLREALGDSADNPRFIETIPRRGYRFVAPVKAIQRPADSLPTSSAQESGQSGHPVSGNTTAGAQRPNPQVGGILRTAAVVLVVLSLFGLVMWRWFGKRPDIAAKATPSVSASAPLRRSVAVLGFRNLPGRHDDDWLSGAFTEMLGTELAAGGSLRVVSDEDVARVKGEMAFGDQDTLAQPTLARLLKDPGADVIVVGSYTAINGKDSKRIRLDVRVQDTKTGETVAEDAVSGSEDELFEMVSRAGADLRASLGVYRLRPEDASMVRASLPDNNVAVRFYSQGTSKLWAFDFAGARDDLTKALEADPKYPLAHAALSDAFWHLGYRGKSRAEAKRAVELSSQLPQEERLLIAGQYAKSLDDWRSAVNTYNTLFNLRRDRLDYGLLLAAAQFHANSSDVAQTLDALRRLPPPANEDARIDLLEASAEIGHDLPKAQAAAKRALMKGSAIGSPLIVAHAYGILCQQGSSLGSSIDEIAVDCDRAIQSYSAAGDHYNEVRTRNDSAGVFYSRGDLRQAEKIWRDAAKEFAKLDERQGAAATHNNLGEVLMLQGHLTEARKMLNAAIPDYEAAEDIKGVELILNDLANLSREEGDLPAAEADLHKAQTLASGRNDSSELAYVFSSLGDVQMDRGDLAASRKSYQQSLDLRNQIGEIQTAAQTRVYLAKLSVEEGHPADALEKDLRNCKELFEKEEQVDDQINTVIVLSEALSAQKRFSEAKKELDAIAPLVQKSQNKLLNLRFSLAAAQVAMEMAPPEARAREMGLVRTEAVAAGYVELGFEAELVLVEWQQKVGQTAQAKSRAMALQQAASHRGFERVSAKADALSQGKPI
jgi:DNA-binding winged helix-turn-helix (wHTH) protein/tetratricopeptide (TPR) repeat protein